VTRYRKAQSDLAGLDEILEDPAADREMKSLAETERYEAADIVEKLAGDIRIALLPRDRADDFSVILEVRAGTGGDEAALFAGDLFRMYSRHAELKGWKVEVLSASEGEAGGYKEIIATVA